MCAQQTEYWIPYAVLVITFNYFIHNDKKYITLEMNNSKYAKITQIDRFTTF